MSGKGEEYEEEPAGRSDGGDPVGSCPPLPAGVPEELCNPVPIVRHTSRLPLAEAPYCAVVTLVAATGEGTRAWCKTRVDSLSARARLTPRRVSDVELSAVNSQCLAALLEGE